MNEIGNIATSIREYDPHGPEPQKPEPELSVLKNTSIEFIRRASEGQLSVSFYEKLKNGDSLPQLAGLTSNEAAALIRKHVLSRRPLAPMEELSETAEKIHNALSYATYKRLEHQICLKVSCKLKDIAGRLRAIAADDQLLDRFYRGLQADPRLSAWGEMVAGDRAAYSREDLRRALIAQAESMANQAQGLHAEYLRGREKTLEENPAVSRELLQSLPEGGFARDAFLSNEIKEKRRREFWNDAQEWIKAGSSVGMIFASGGLVKVAKATKLAIDYRLSDSNFAHAGSRAAAALASGGATFGEFEQAAQRRNYNKMVDTISLALSAGGLVSGSVLMNPPDKIIFQLLKGAARTVGSAEALDQIAAGGNDLRRLIVELTSPGHGSASRG